MSSSPGIILQAVGLTKQFGGFTAVRGLDLVVRRGTIHALIGPNGAGKTTVFNLLTKVLPPTRGRIVFKGRDITGLGPWDVARLGMVRSFQISAVFGRKTARQNVRMALQRPTGVSYRFWMSSAWLDRLDAQADALLDQVGLADMADVPAGELPYGRKRALEIATTLALDPELLMLDEPMAGLGQEDIERITELVRTVARSRTVLMVEHNLSVVETLSDTITVLMHGQQLAAGPYAEIASNPAVVDAYMGTGHD